MPSRGSQRFSRFPRVQLIDLDAARGRGDNAAMVASICRRLPCRVGGGIRSVERARDVLGAGAHAVIASSALFRDGAVDVAFARSLADAVGADRVIAAVDSRGGQVVIHGWKTVLPITAVEAVRALEPYCAEFLYTHVDKEGLMQGTDMDAIMAVRRATIPPRDRGRRHHHLGRDRPPRRRRRRRRGRAWRFTPASCPSIVRNVRVVRNGQNESNDSNVRTPERSAAIRAFCVTLVSVTVTPNDVISRSAP